MYFETCQGNRFRCCTFNGLCEIGKIDGSSNRPFEKAQLTANDCRACLAPGMMG